MKAKKVLHCFRIAGYLIKNRMNPFTYIQQVLALKDSTNYSIYEIIGCELANASLQKQESFLPYADYLDMACKLNPDSERIKVTDKIYALNQLGNMIQREWLDLRKCSADVFIDFYRKHKEVFIKHYCYAFGRFIYHYQGEKSEKELHKIYDFALKNELYLVEQPIRQHEVIAEICPYCVNPIRIHTVNNGDEVKIMYLSSISFGSKKSVVSNIGYVGAALIENGQIATDLFVYKPPFIRIKKTCKGSAKQIKGMDIPFYREMEALVKQAALKFPTLPYLGFDIAVTPDGPEIIEINAISGFFSTGQLITNNLHGRGTRSEIMAMFNYAKKTEEGELFDEKDCSTI